MATLFLRENRKEDRRKRIAGRGRRGERRGRLGVRDVKSLPSGVRCRVGDAVDALSDLRARIGFNETIIVAFQDGPWCKMYFARALK